MVRHLFIVMLCLTAGCVGCARTVSESALREYARMAQGETLGQVDYLGRQSDYDYFRVHWNVGSARYRIHVPNDVVREPQTLQSPPRNVGPHELDRWLP